MRRCRSFFFMDGSLKLVLDLPVGNSKSLPKLFCSFGLTLFSYQTCTYSDPNSSQRSPPEASLPQPQCRAHTKTKSCWEQRSTLRNSVFCTAAHVSCHTDIQQNQPRYACKNYSKIPLPIKEREGMKQLCL